MYLTPLVYYKRISGELGVNVYVKHDDLYPLPGGGSKGRKLKYILNQNAIKSYDSIVTAGSNQSNHLRSTALLAAKLGWKLICIVHDNQVDRKEGNLKIIELAGAEVKYVQKTDVKVEMDNAMEGLRKLGYNPLYIYGGGHCVEGSFAYYEAVKELIDQLKGINPQFIFVASGTGTTQAGIELGVRAFMSDCKVIGVSVAREAQRGKQLIIESINELAEYLSINYEIVDDITFDDSWMGGGYENTYPELIKTIKWAASTEGLILDPTYTGKAFHALINYVKTGIIQPNSNVIFWHTGGLLNLMASKEL